MKIGFTGTQKGMTDFQKSEVSMILLFHNHTGLSDSTFQAHHGDCIGADAEFEQLAKKYGFTTYAHPASDTVSKRAYCKSDFILPSQSALKRNRSIVDIADIMIATPAQNHEILRSGTWATIRYCRKTYYKNIERILHVVYP